MWENGPEYLCSCHTRGFIDHTLRNVGKWPPCVGNHYEWFLDEVRQGWRRLARRPRLKGYAIFHGVPHILISGMRTTHLLINQHGSDVLYPRRRLRLD